MRILFIVKKQRLGYSGGGPSSGLFNSAKFVSDMLREELGQDSKLVLVTDNNDIDREVARFRPKIVIIEALWVEPNKFHRLVKLHPHVRWVVRNHSAMPFLAHEGMALNWIFRYLRTPHVEVGCNDHRTRRELDRLAATAGIRDVEIAWLPNYYPPTFHPRPRARIGHSVIHVGCFGAIRPLKNHLIQAVAAIHYAQTIGADLYFHINSTRIECDGEPVLRNLRALFDNMPNHNLVEHPWLERKEFIDLVRIMDIGLQCTYSETFNIVAADFVMNDVPVVVSKEISWVFHEFWADPNDSNQIALKMAEALHRARHHRENPSVHLLRVRDRLAIREWSEFLHHHGSATS